jgi:4-alpha-glucanotransferase
MNPLNALEDHLCPYSAAGRFSRNKFIVNLNELVSERYGKLLRECELPEDITAPSFTLEMLEKQKNPRFQLAFKRFSKLSETHPIKVEYSRFLGKNDKLWLDEYANYDILSKRFGSDWHNWPRKFQTAPEDAKRRNVKIGEIIYPLLKKKDASLTQEEFNNLIGLYKFEQFLFDKQFHELVKELDSKGIRLILDLPIGVSAEGVDTWGKKSIFLLDKNFKPTKSNGNT